LPVTEATESAAPPRASPSSFDSTTPVKFTPSSKALRSTHRVLTDHRVDHEQHFVRLHGVANIASLLHERPHPRQDGRRYR
jgi:hypothetical protein